jgi:heterodisulfide reductase subunit C
MTTENDDSARARDDDSPSRSAAPEPPDSARAREAAQTADLPSSADAPRPENPAAAPPESALAPAESVFAPPTASGRALTEVIRSDPRMEGHRDGFLSCIQCGICTSGCPAARFTDYSPREIARRALEGDETLLTDDSIWYCFSCYTCQLRCPRQNSVAVIVQVLRSLQVESGYGARHVQPMVRWCQNFYDDGMGGNPHLFFPEIKEAFGTRWRTFIEHLLEVREMLGLGPLYPSPECVKEVRVLMEETGFKQRLERLGAWGGQRGWLPEKDERLG